MLTVQSLAALIGIERRTQYRPDAAACRALAQEVLWRSNKDAWAVVSFIRARLQDHYALVEKYRPPVTTIYPDMADGAWVPRGKE